MENIVFERNYERVDKEDAHAAAIFDRVYAPGGFMDEITKKFDAIPKVVVPKDKETYEYLLDLCDKFAQRHHGRIHGVVDMSTGTHTLICTFDCSNLMIKRIWQY